MLKSQIFTMQTCLLLLFGEIKFSRRFQNLQYPIEGAKYSCTSCFLSKKSFDGSSNFPAIWFEYSEIKMS